MPENAEILVLNKSCEAIGDSVLDNSIHPDDDMFCGSLEHYESCGKQFADFVVHASRLADSPTRRILELPCGYGRVTRHLVQRFSPSDIVVADAMPRAVNFCMEQFGVSGIEVTEPLEEFRSVPEEAFQVAAMGSLITHLDEDSSRSVIKNFLGKLSRGGVAVITTHGKRAREILFSDLGWFELLQEDRERLKRASIQGQYGYAKYAPNHTFERRTVESVGDDYGISLIPHEWIVDVVSGLGFAVIDYAEGGWDNHQDVYFVGY